MKEDKCNGLIIGILVVYSNNYYYPAILEFKRILKMTSSTTQLIVVANNKEIIFGPEIENGAGLYSDNRLYEFSAWQDGLDYALSNRTQSTKIDGFIFANDTFCHHRDFGFLERFLFSRCSTRAFKSITPLISGECSSFNKDFVFNKINMREWISTYLFSINSSLMELLGYSLVKDGEKVELLLSNSINPENFFSPDLDPSLRFHLNKWIFGADGTWRNFGKISSENYSKYHGKARSILYEKLLSARCIAVQGVTFNFHQSRVFKIKRKFLRIKFYFEKLLATIYK